MVAGPSLENSVMQKNIPHLGFITFLVLISIPLGQVAIDMYLPSLPSMTEHLHSSASEIQQTLTVYLLSLGASQLFYGPITDRFGRRNIFLFGYGLFAVSTFACFVSQHAGMLLIARFFQGMGAGCGFVVSNAIMADLFTGKKLSRMIVYCSFTWSLTPIIAPVIGGVIQNYLGWRINFLIMLIYSLLLLLSFYFFLPETLDKENQHSLHPILLFKSYLSIFNNITFIGFMLCVTFSYGAVIAFNVVGPFILQEKLKINAAQYGFYVLIVGLAYTIGIYLNSLLLKKWAVLPILGWGMAWTLLSGLSLILFSFFNWFSVASVITGTCILQIAQGLVFANCLSGSLALFGKQNGSISALFGCVTLVGCTVISAIVSELHINTQVNLGWVYIILGALGTIGYLLVLWKARESSC